MAEQGHTPGPWRIVPRNDQSDHMDALIKELVEACELSNLLRL